MDVVKMFEPVTKWATSVRHAEVIPETVRKAVRLARGEKPGAVLIELPEDIAKHETTEQPLPVIRFRRSLPDTQALDSAFELLTAAQRPVIIAGNGCIRSRASARLRELCDLTGIGVLSTFMGKGAVDMDASYCLYTVGLSQKDIVSCALDAADVVLTLGFDMVEYHPHLWNSDRSKRIVHADFIPSEIDAHFQPEVELVGDLALTLEALTERFRNRGVPDYELSQQSAARREMQGDLARYDTDETEGCIRPQKMLADLRAVLDPGDVLLSDVGAHKMWIARHFHCHEPNTCLIPNGFCSMGFALPGVIAAALVNPDRRAVAISGDGGFLMNVQEMETAARLGLSLTVVVWEDKEYGLIAWKQSNEFGWHTPLSFGNPDWLGLAAAFGWHGHKVENSLELQSVLRRALDESGPSLIVLPIDYRENALLTQHLGEIICPI
jgi:acetolactate synthase-1/2/3 large subunit